jgi:hypothetical protein
MGSSLESRRNAATIESTLAANVPYHSKNRRNIEWYGTFGGDWSGREDARYGHDGTARGHGLDLGFGLQLDHG